MASLQCRRLWRCCKYTRYHRVLHNQASNSFYSSTTHHLAKFSSRNSQFDCSRTVHTRCLSTKSAIQPNWDLQRIWIATNIGCRETYPVGVKFNVGYIDTAHDLPINQKAKLPVILGVHGVPDTHEDFAKFLKRYTQQGYRVILPNLPSFGITTFIDRDEMQYFKHSTAEQFDFIVQFLDAINVPKLHLVIGHSVGTLPLTILCAKSTQLSVQGAVFLCPIHGHKYPQGMQPEWLMYRIGRWWYGGLVRRWICVQIYKQFVARRNMVKQSSTEEAGAIIQIGINMAFHYLPTLAMEMNLKKFPLLYVITEHDPLINAGCSKDYADMLGVANHNFTVYDELGKLVERGENSSRTYSRGVLFKTNSHKPHTVCELAQTLHSELNEILQYIEQKQ